MSRQCPAGHPLRPGIGYGAAIHLGDERHHPQAGYRPARETGPAVQLGGRGYKDIDDLAANDYKVFENLAALWRKKHPAEVMLSRGGVRLPLVFGRAMLEANIKQATDALRASLSGEPPRKPVLIGRTPHVLSMLGNKALDDPLPMWIDATVQTKVFFGKHADKMAGVTPDMLVRAMYRPAAVIKDGKESGSVMLVTNILTENGPVVVEVKANGDMEGQQAAIIRSAYTKESGLVADWVNGKDAAREMLYIDPVQIGEAVTGNLNPENQNATRSGWRVVPATGEINDFRPSAWGPTSPTSDKPSIAKWGTPANKNYRGLATIDAKLQQRITGRGMPKVKTYDDLLAWIGKHHKGDEADRPMFSRTTQPASEELPVKLDGLWTVNAAPKVGEKFIVYRFGNASGELAGRNAGNSWGVVYYIMTQEDYDRPSNGTFGTHIHAYEVEVSKPFGSYVGITRGGNTRDVQTGAPVGRTVNGGGVAYSFERDGAWKAKTLGYVTMDQVRQAIIDRTDGQYSDFDGTGTVIGMEVLNSLFADKIAKAEGFETPRLSRAAAQQTPQPVAARADAIIADATAKWRPVDAIVKAGVQLTRFDRATSALYAQPCMYEGNNFQHISNAALNSFAVLPSRRDNLSGCCVL